MNITCAYCHIKGHHIKFCEELIEKNRRRDAYKNKTPTPLMAVRSSPSPKKTSNIFANLDGFSSEEEEGEIVEEDRKLRLKSLASDSLSDTDSNASLIESESSSVNSWSRRGTKGIVLRVPTVTQCEEPDSDEEWTPSEQFIKFMECSRQFLCKYDGMSWADIECLSDAE